MSRPKGKKTQPPQAQAATHEADPPPEPLIDRILLFILLALIPFRAICGETHTYELLRWLQLGDAPGSPTPATTLGIVLLIFTCGIVWLAVRLWRGVSLSRPTAIGVGLLLMIVAAVASTFAAGQKYLALVGCLDFLALILYMIVLRQLLRRPWHVRLAMTVVLATGVVVLAKCANQYFYENPETLAYYEEHKAELTSGGNAQVAAGMLHDYEQRMKAGSVTGFFVHPNVLASYLILIILASFAVALHKSRRRKGWPFVPPLLLAHGAMMTISLTQSKGAMAAAALALIMWGAGRWLAGPSPDAKRRKQLAYGLAACVVLGAIGVGAVLKSNPSALGRSMLFRTMYWDGGERIVKANGLWCGVGANNFGRWFPTYKDITCPEDVDDPHCWPLKLLVEWGLPALVGVLLIFVGVARQLTRDPSRLGPGAPTRPGSFILWGAGLIAFVIVWWAAIIGLSSIAYLAFMIELTAISWMIGFFLLAYDGQRSPIGGRSFPGMFSDSTPGVCVGGLLAGAIGFAIHTCVDLAMFNGGAATTFFALLAIAMATRQIDAVPIAEAVDRPAKPAQPRQGLGLLVGVCGGIAMIAFAALVVRPAVVYGEAIETARRAAQVPNQTAYTAAVPQQAYRAAIAANPLDSTAARELAEDLIRRSGTMEQTDRAEAAIDTFAAADPYSTMVPRLRATLDYRRYMLTQDAKHVSNAVEHMQHAVKVNPSSIHNRQSLAELLSRLAEATGDAAVRRRAIDAWQDVLKLDEQRVYVSQPHHLSDEQKASIAERINALRQPPTQ